MQRIKQSANNPSSNEENNNPPLNTEDQEAMIAEFWQEKQKQDKLWRYALTGLSVGFILFLLQMLLIPNSFTISAIEYNVTINQLKLSQLSRSVILTLNIFTIIMLQRLSALKVTSSRNKNQSRNSPTKTNDATLNPVNPFSLSLSDSRSVSYLAYFLSFLSCSIWAIMLVLHGEFSSALFLPFLLLFIYFFLTIYSINQASGTELEIKQLEKLKYNLHTA
jgi:hypothetical protein